jgi:SAM-dependent methyltransferase
VQEYTQRTYGEEWAAEYDSIHGELDPMQAVETLADLAAGRPVLELAIGTGRIALPLKERGVEIHGVDISDAMVAQLRKKPGGEEIPVTMGNFAEVDFGGKFPIIFLAFNTIFGLLTQEDQLRLFENVAKQLTEDGVFLIEAFVPDLTRYNRDQRVSALEVELDSVRIEFSKHDPSKQLLESQIATLSADGIKMRPIRLRYAYPPELDLMAKLAGLRLRERWGGWDRSEFGPRSSQHVSVYERT